MAKKKPPLKKQETKKPAPGPKPAKTGAKSRINYRVFLAAAAVLIVTFIAFYPSVHNGFTNWDDPGYVTENTIITKMNAETVKYIFSNFIMTNYHPLTMLSFALDYDAVKLDPARYHIVNFIFHLLNTLLVFIFIYMLSGKKIIPAAVVALIFGIHPMHVESVSWISGRKDVLFAFFFVLGMITYHRYAGKEKWRALFYLLTIILFVLSLLSKPAAVTFPVVMLLLDFFLKRKMGWKCWMEKIPFFLAAIFFGILSVKAQTAAHAVSDWSTMGIHHRLFFASFGFVAYIWKFLAPYGLSAFYPYPVRFPVKEALPVLYYIAPAVILGLCYLAYRSLKLSRVYVFGFLFYIINVLLILQFVSVGAALMADRYTYLPYIGLAFIAGMELDRLYKSSRPSLRIVKYVIAAILASYGIALAVMTFQRAQVWKNNDVLWTDVIEKYPGKVEVAYKNRGNYYAREANKYDKALQDYASFISIKPDDASIYSNRGNIYGMMMENEKSIAEYTKALSIDSNYEDAYINRAITYGIMKKYDLALADIDRAMKINPDKLDAHVNRANCLVNLGKNEETFKECDYILSKAPDNYLAYLYRGIAWFNTKRYQEALADFSATIQRNPSYPDAFHNRSQVHFMLGDYPDALNDAMQAKKLGYPVRPEFIEMIKEKMK